MGLVFWFEEMTFAMSFFAMLFWYTDALQQMLPDLNWLWQWQSGRFQMLFNVVDPTDVSQQCTMGRKDMKLTRRVLCYLLVCSLVCSQRSIIWFLYTACCERAYGKEFDVDFIWFFSKKKNDRNGFLSFLGATKQRGAVRPSVRPSVRYAFSLMAEKGVS